MDSTHVMKTLQLWPIVTLDPGSGELVAFDPGPQRTLHTLHTLGSPDHRGGGPASSKHRPVASRRYRAQAWLDGECVLDAIIDDKHHNIHHLQPLGDDLLLACARSHQRGGYSRLNGRVYSRSGELLRELALGDGIEHLQTTARGEIWTGYFDEGVFGDDPISTTGLVAWDAQGTSVFRYDPPAPLDSMADCYALNLASHDETWLCYYTGFPLVQLRDHRIVRSWTLPDPAIGSHAFAVHHRHVLFAGGYRHRDTYHLLSLDDGPQACAAASFELIDEDGEPLRAARVAGRGDTLYLLSGRRIYACDIHRAISESGR